MIHVFGWKWRVLTLYKVHRANTLLVLTIIYFHLIFLVWKAWLFYLIPYVRRKSNVQANTLFFFFFFFWGGGVREGMGWGGGGMVQSLSFWKWILNFFAGQPRSTVRAPVFRRHQFFGTSEHYGKAHGSLLSGWMNYNYTACCWFPTSNNILILPSQFWQIRFESYWLNCSKCRILVLLRYSWNREF